LLRLHGGGSGWDRSTPSKGGTGTRSPSQEGGGKKKITFSPAFDHHLKRKRDRCEGRDEPSPRGDIGGEEKGRKEPIIVTLDPTLLCEKGESRSSLHRGGEGGGKREPLSRAKKKVQRRRSCNPPITLWKKRKKEEGGRRVPTPSSDTYYLRGEVSPPTTISKAGIDFMKEGNERNSSFPRGIFFNGKRRVAESRNRLRGLLRNS